MLLRARDKTQSHQMNRKGLIFLFCVCCPAFSAGYWPHMWSGLEYDSIITVENLQEAGWNCYRIDKTEEGFDGMCGPNTAPRFSVFGVPTSASSVFLRGNKSASVNLGFHETSQEFILENLAHELGKPTGVEFLGTDCTIEWNIGRRQYTFGYTGLRGAYARLFISFPHLIDSNSKIEGVSSGSSSKLCEKYAKLIEG